MSTKISDLAEKLDIPVADLKAKIVELGFELSPKARVIEETLAEMIEEELSGGDTKGGEGKDGDIAEIYDEMIAEEREREIVKSQRKKMAGKGEKKKGKTEEAPTVVAIEGEVEIPEVISVKEFAEKTGANPAKVIGELMKNGILANINQQIDFETASIIAGDLGLKIKRIRKVADTEELMSGDISNLIREDNAEDLEERPAVVCVMGHVDHGKTQLLDTIREANVISGESGGITQHIGAYQVQKKGKLITFLDTPGHEAFTSMRARGAKVTDIAILVVAADEGMKPQTIEAMNHAKEAGVPIIVAVNKMDKPNANLDKVKGELSEHDLQPEDWGGKTIVCPVSALKGTGIEDLLDMVLLTAEMEVYKANPNREAVGTVIEAHLDQSLGPVATILVNTGTLKIMNNVIVGNAYGRIKVMKDHNGKPVRKAGPATPVMIAGLSETPKSGDILQVVASEKVARDKADEIRIITKEDDQARMSASNQIISQIKQEKVFKLIVKADAKGSMEAIRQSIGKIKDEEVAVKIIHSGVGKISESDVMMASASRAMVVGFHAGFDSANVPRVAERENVEVKEYKIIYDLLEDIKKYLSGLIEAEKLEVVIGRATVKQIFLTTKKEMIVGARVTSGKITGKAKLKVIRGRTEEDEDKVVGRGVIEALRKVDDVVKEIKEGNECGIKFRGDIALEEGDILEAFVEEEKHRVIE
jgi:translation initiation factor IF-2